MKELFTTKELTQLLKVDPKTIWNWRQEGMPFIRINTAIRFDLDEVREWIDHKQGESKT